MTCKEVAPAIQGNGRGREDPKYSGRDHKQHTLDGYHLQWAAHEVRVLDAFGDEVLRLTINEAGEVGRWLPHCQRHIKVLGERYQPLTSRPLKTEADAEALASRVMEAIGWRD